MSEDGETGVIDRFKKVHNYDNRYIIDGSMMSANPGVNPSLPITAIAEHAMAKIQET